MRPTPSSVPRFGVLVWALSLWSAGALVFACDDATQLDIADTGTGPATDLRPSVDSANAAPSDGGPRLDDLQVPEPVDGHVPAPDAPTAVPADASSPIADAAPPTPDTSAAPQDLGVPTDGPLPAADTASPPPADAFVPTADLGLPPDAAGLDGFVAPPDLDGDGLWDDQDPCPNVADDGADLDRDGAGDACDDDVDGDGLPDLTDLCPRLAAAPGAQPDADLDADGLGDACDDDADADAVPDVDDNCLGLANPDQANGDFDGSGDACDVCPLDTGDDSDLDGLCALDDNCPETGNPDQADLDDDGTGDTCDADSDGDGIDGALDNCPDAANPEQADLDGDLRGDACDPPTCDDLVPDGAETDLDCGGPDCDPCRAGEACALPRDCQTGVCSPDGACRPAACDDGVSNGDETGLDCGGPVCLACDAGQVCAADADCTSDFCVDRRCRAPACNDRRPNGDETDVDCGGPDCVPCGPGGGCALEEDCDDGDACTDDRCLGGVCGGTAVEPAWRAVRFATDLSSLSPAEALVADPTTGVLYARSQQNPSGVNIQLIRITLDGQVTRLVTLANLRSSNLSGVGVDTTGDLLFADETWANRGRIAGYGLGNGAVRTVFATPWILNPVSTGAGQMRFAPDLDTPTRLFYFDGTTAKIFGLDRSVQPAVNRLVLSVADNQADGRHPNLGSDLRYDARRHVLMFLDTTLGMLSELDPSTGDVTPWGALGVGYSRIIPHAALQSLFASNGNEVVEIRGPGPVLRPVLSVPGVRDLAVGPNPARAGGLSLYALVPVEDAVYELLLDNEACFVVPTCLDGRRNGGETGVDCGGECAACLPDEPCGADEACFDADDCTVDACVEGDCRHEVQPDLCPDVDLDGDGLLNGLEAVLGLDPLSQDSDGDGLGDDTEDADEDTLSNLAETAGGLPIDTDLDGTLDALDLDSDADTLPDRLEAGDADRLTPAADSDADGTPDFQDADSDGDRLPDLTEALEGPGVEPDPDADGIRPSLDLDSDDDGVEDGAEGAEDRDADGIVDFLDPQDLRVYSAHGVGPGTCEGQSQDGLCSGPFYVDVVFPRPFDLPPHVLVTAEEVSDEQGCVAGATDKVVAYPANITPEGFRLYAYGSPWGGNCGALNGWASLARAGWMAIEAVGAERGSPHGPIVSAHNVLGLDCEGVADGGLCNGSFYTDVRFETPYARPPHVLVSAENVSNQGGCVGGATDQVVARPANITEHGFRLYVHGSPMQSCGDSEGWASRATAGYLVVPQGPQRVSGHGVSPALCTGALVGGLCGGGFYEDLRFAAPLLTAPHVLTSGEVISSQGGCVGGAMDKLSVYPEAVDAAGFRLFARGSPESGSCGAFDGYGSRARAGFLAIQ